MAKPGVLHWMVSIAKNNNNCRSLADYLVFAIMFQFHTIHCLAIVNDSLSLAVNHFIVYDHYFNNYEHVIQVGLGVGGICGLYLAQNYQVQIIVASS